MQIPLGIILSNRIRKFALGEVIQDIKLNCFNEGEYCLDTLSFEKIKELIGQKIVKVDTDSLYAENGMVVEFRDFSCRKLLIEMIGNLQTIICLL